MGGWSAVLFLNGSFSFGLTSNIYEAMSVWVTKTIINDCRRRQPNLPGGGGNLFGVWQFVLSWAPFYGIRAHNVSKVKARWEVACLKGWHMCLQQMEFQAAWGKSWH